jgi:hypothetical protein
MAKSQALQSNMDVDYVLSYRFAKTGTQMAGYCDPFHADDM